jgi:hypothetical protein
MGTSHNKYISVGQRVLACLVAGVEALGLFPHFGRVVSKANLDKRFIGRVYKQTSFGG